MTDADLTRKIANLQKRLSLLTVSGQPKTAKGLKKGVLTAVLHLAPASIAGGKNVCPSASPACLLACLNTAGRGGIPQASYAGRESPNAVQAARVRKTREMFADRAAFIARIDSDIARIERFAAANGLDVAVRLNGTSDLAWEKLAPSLFSSHPAVEFYDYTKIPGRTRLPANYTLTFSRSEVNETKADKVLSSGANVAIVFATKRGHPLPRTWHGYRVVDGDETDLRYLDPAGVVVGLRAKGKARGDVSGFVVPVRARHAGSQRIGA